MSPGEPPVPQHKRLARPAALAAARPERMFPGIAVSPGVAIGPVFGASEPVPEITRQKIQAADIAGEGARLEAAIAQSRKQLGKLRARLAILPEESQAEIAPLIDAYIRMLGPSRLVPACAGASRRPCSRPRARWSRRPMRSPRPSSPRQNPA